MARSTAAATLGAPALKDTVPPETARVALVIGNSSYAGIWPDLQGEPRQDAQIMRETLLGLGFEVIYRRDADLSRMKRALYEFRLALQKHPGAIAVVYYAGHGTQAPVTPPKGDTWVENFLVPAHTDLAQESDAHQKAIGIGRISHLIRDAGASIGVILLDASRDNALPHLRKGVPVARHGFTGRSSDGILLVYAAQPSHLTHAPHDASPSVFTQILAEEMRHPGTLERTMLRVQERVREATQGDADGAQEPDIRARLHHEVSLALSPPGDSMDPKPPAGAPVTFRDCTECPIMVQIPPGSFLMGSPEEEAHHRPSEGPVHEVHITSAFAASQFPITRGQWRQYLTATGRTASTGCYGFNHTLGQWARTPEYSWSDPGFRQEDSHPAVCITWTEAQEYTAWLTQKTGHHYRLLSEAEYEYLERAGNPTAFPWGSEGQCTQVNGADAVAQTRFPSWTDAAHCSDGYLFTSPVDHFPANAFGLYDIAGNVRSWTQDCYHPTYQDAPTDGSPWESGDCSLRVLRGGAWDSRPETLRVARRLWEQATGSTDSTGLRVARTDPAVAH